MFYLRASVVCNSNDSCNGKGNCSIFSLNSTTTDV